MHIEGTGQAAIDDHQQGGDLALFHALHRLDRQTSRGDDGRMGGHDFANADRAQVAQAVKDLTTYVDAEQVTPALEFVSPVKGPNLEKITVEVGSGIATAAEGAARYDEDVKKQAQQLGLEGW